MARLKNLINPLSEDTRTCVVEPYLSQWRQYVYRLSVTLLMRARDHAAAERRRHSTLNYGDLLNLTARVLREHPQVRRALQREYQHLFVDEFQDTDPVQAELVFLLAASEPEVALIRSVDWRRLPPRPVSLFVVGDGTGHRVWSSAATRDWRPAAGLFEHAAVLQVAREPSRPERAAASALGHAAGPRLAA